MKKSGSGGNRFGNDIYGVDELERFILSASFIMVLISVFIRSYVLSVIIAVVLVYGIFRIFSRNYEARQMENAKYLEFCDRVKSVFHGGAKAAEDKEHVYFRCPNCHQLVRVPKGKGRISIHCPKCHTDFERRT